MIWYGTRQTSQAMKSSAFTGPPGLRSPIAARAGAGRKFQLMTVK